MALKQNVSDLMESEHSLSIVTQLIIERPKITLTKITRVADSTIPLDTKALKLLTVHKIMSKIS